MIGRPPKGWDKPNRLRFFQDIQREARMLELYELHDGDHDKVLSAIAQEYGWTAQQAYVATEFMFRPENHN